MKKEKLEMRELLAGDVFQVLEIVDKLDITEEVEKMTSDTKQNVNDVYNEIAAELSANGVPESEITPELIAKDPRATKINNSYLAVIIKLVIKNVPKAKKEINGLLADLCGVKRSDIESLSLVEYVGLIKDFFKKSELSELFSSVSELLD